MCVNMLRTAYTSIQRISAFPDFNLVSILRPYRDLYSVYLIFDGGFTRVLHDITECFNEVFYNISYRLLFWNIQFSFIFS